MNTVFQRRIHRVCYASILNETDMFSLNSVASQERYITMINKVRLPLLDTKKFSILLSRRLVAGDYSISMTKPKYQLPSYQ